MGNEPIAREYLSLIKQWEDASPESIAANTEKQLTEKFPECISRSVVYDKLSEITGSSKHTVYAWFNKSRNSIKIPLVKLCIIAEALNTDVMKFLMEDGI